MKTYSFTLLLFFVNLCLNAQWQSLYPESYWEWRDDFFFNKIKDVHFLSDDIGYVTASFSDYYKTSDGGDTWKFVNTDINESITQIQFLTEEVGFILTDIKSFTKQLMEVKIGQ